MSESIGVIKEQTRTLNVKDYNNVNYNPALSKDNIILEHDNNLDKYKSFREYLKDFYDNIVRTFCIEEYQIAKCPDNLYLDSYYITAENSENAIKAVENILIENNFNLDDYEIIVDKSIIKIIEKEKQEIEETQQTGTEIQETEETTTTQENNLEIENESVEFDNENNNEVIKRNIPILIPDIF